MNCEYKENVCPELKLKHSSSTPANQLSHNQPGTPQASKRGSDNLTIVFHHQH